MYTPTNHPLIVGMIGIACVISACSSSNDDAASSVGGTSAGGSNAQADIELITSAPLTQLGFFDIDTLKNGLDTRINVEANFILYDRDISQVLANQLPTTEDTCDVDNGEDDGEAPDPELLEIINNLTSISAGDTIVLSSPGGTFATIAAMSTSGNISYEESLESEQLPQGLLLDIPGDAFPAFSNIAVPDVIGVSEFNYSTENLTDTTTITWAASTKPNTRINLGIQTSRLGNPFIFIDCDVVDDGSFTLPAETLAEVGSFSDAVIYNADRYDTELTRSGNSMLFVTNSVLIDVQSMVGGETTGTGSDQ